jgi:hypothetical protein
VNSEKCGEKRGISEKLKDKSEKKRDITLSNLPAHEQTPRRGVEFHIYEFFIFFFSFL